MFLEGSPGHTGAEKTGRTDRPTDLPVSHEVVRDRRQNGLFVLKIVSFWQD